MRWFGEDWGAPVCEDGEHAPTPVGAKCGSCGELIEEGDRGFLLPHLDRGFIVREPWHFTCLMEDVLGPEWQFAFTPEESGGGPPPPSIT